LIDSERALEQATAFARCRTETIRNSEAPFRTGHALFVVRVQGDRPQAQSHRAATSEDFPIAQKTIATLLILSAFAIAGENSASAQDGD